mmetsp:Transcript_31298/g.89817  ORF Transcript_31298/g.89817 Transcript_31298/m.89817 type:complete len:219 (-) Transcript_31298:77-733(-)
MELHVVETEGIPEGCVISVRAGSTRRQAPVSADRPFRFPTPLAEAVPFKVDVLEPVASARLILRPGEERRTDCQYTIPLEPAPAEGSGKEVDGAAGLAAKASAPDMNVTIAVKPSDEEKKSGVEEPEDKNATKVVLDAGTEGDASRPSTNPKAKRGSSGSAASSRHGQANAAREYLDQHNLVEFTQLLVQSVIKEQPDKPYAFMARQFYFPDPKPRTG